VESPIDNILIPMITTITSVANSKEYRKVLNGIRAIETLEELKVKIISKNIRDVVENAIKILKEQPQQLQQQIPVQSNILHVATKRTTAF